MRQFARCLTVSLVAAVGGRALSSGTPETPWTGPVLVSPGGSGSEGRALTGCPTFSWAAQWPLAQAVQSYQLTVYAIGSARSQDPALRVTLPAGASAWTPEAGSCLSPGRYGWAVGAVMGAGEASETRWSRPALFRVLGAPLGPDASSPRGSGTVAPQPVAPALPVRAGSEGGGPTLTHGDAVFSPPGCNVGEETFSDVPAADPFCEWIEQLAREGLSNGCGGGKFCPDAPVTRRQLAMILERSLHGTATWAPAPNGPRSRVLDVPLGDGGGDIDIAIGADGLPVISHRTATSSALEVVHCNNLDCTALDAHTVENLADNLASFNAIAIGNDGLPIVAYSDDSAGTLKVAHCGDAACASSTISTIDDPADSVGSWVAIAIGADTLPIISYQDTTAGTLRVAHCNNAACSGVGGATVNTVDDPADGHLVGARTSIAIGADDRPVISYVDDDATTLKVAHCDDFACAPGGETITSIADGGHAIGFESHMAVLAGLPIVAYYDATSKSLNLLRCNNAACTSSNKFTIDDPADDVGNLNSIAVGADGLPVIGYGDFTAGTLRVVHCSAGSCALAGNQISVVDDPAGDANSHNAIEIGIDSAPIIAYQGPGNTLKVLHCGTITCAP